MVKAPSRIGLVVILLLIALLSAQVHAFDNQRKGFVLGFSMGPSVAFSIEEYRDDTSAALGIGTEFTMGYAPIDHLQVHYAGRTDWIHIYYPLATLSGGVTCYLKPEAPSWLITGGGGIALPLFGLESFDEFEVGRNFFAGAGYEWAPHWRVSAEYTRYWYRYYNRDLDELRVVIGYLGY